MNYMLRGGLSITLSKYIKKIFIALFYAIVYVLLLFKVSEQLDAPLGSYSRFCACYFKQIIKKILTAREEKRLFKK